MFEQPGKICTIGANIILHIQLDVYPMCFAILNVIYVANWVYCFISKYNFTLSQTILKLDIVKLRKKIK